jgi:hypothetical protein
MKVQKVCGVGVLKTCARPCLLLSNGVHHVACVSSAVGGAKAIAKQKFSISSFFCTMTENAVLPAA